MTTWVEGAAGSLFDVDNLPYGVFSRAGEEPRVGVRIGDHVLDLSPVAAAEMLDVHHVFQEPSLNALMAEGRAVRESVRTLADRAADRRDRARPRRAAPASRWPTSTLHLPIEVADYVDFYASLEHATNVGRIFRPDAEALLPNWRHLPVGYHGRAGTVVASRHRRSSGRAASGRRPPSDGADVRPEPPARHRGRARLRRRHAARRSATGSPFDGFADHVFGVVGLNDWSARDIQAWEYVPARPVPRQVVRAPRSRTG